MSKRDADHAGIRFPPPFVFLGFLLLGPLLDRLAGLPKLSLPFALTGFLAILLIVAGLTVALLATRRFGAAGTRVEPWAPTSAIVTDGVYRYTRNPMYLGMILLSFGLGLLFRSPGSLLLVPLAAAAIAVFVIPREEAYLEHKFGADYLAYRKRVRRWF